MRKFQKVLIILFILILIILLCNNNVFAEDLLDNLDDFDPLKNTATTEVQLRQKINPILSVLRMLGAIVSVVTMMILGFKYMIGSAEEKASYKKTMIPWLIGAFLLFTVNVLPSILKNLTLNLW